MFNAKFIILNTNRYLRIEFSRPMPSAAKFNIFNTKSSIFRSKSEHFNTKSEHFHRQSTFLPSSVIYTLTNGMQATIRSCAR